ncbi:unnamed protein product [Prorocentrum cordatum]|uniref:Uncharacterized protein n=1 Tax=Prorocentrum cordatum TaxID=2364126 RepID=A0ABN9RIJ8_9DINO|nr:unnamed protein product [Polarella glacialis]
MLGSFLLTLPRPSEGSQRPKAAKSFPPRLLPGSARPCARLRGPLWPRPARCPGLSPRPAPRTLRRHAGATPGKSDLRCGAFLEDATGRASSRYRIARGPRGRGLGLEVWGRRLRLPRQGPAGPGSLAAAAAGEAAPGGAAAPRHPRVLGRGVVLPVGGGGTPRRGRRTSSTPWVTMKRRRPRIVLHFSTSFQSSALRTKRLLLQSLPSNTQ